MVWPKVEIVFRGDSGFCRWGMLALCERHEVSYSVGIAKNTRLNSSIEAQIGEAALACQRSRRKIRGLPNSAMARTAGIIQGA